MHFVFWQNIISPHQASFLRALAEMGHEVTVVAAEVMTANRLAMGWQAPDLGRCKIILAPSPEEIRRITEAGGQNSDLRNPIHILAGARWTSLGDQAMKWCRVFNRNTGVLTEAPDPRGFSGFARRLKYTAERLANGRKFDFILAMGEMGVRWFQQCGYPPARLFPFAYVTEQMSGLRPPTCPQVVAPSGPSSDLYPPSSVSFLFVGRLIPLKGVDLLLRSFTQISAPSSKLQASRLTLVGEGSEKDRLQALAETLGILDRVEWLGVKRSSEIPTLMARADVLVLPSRKDGWGAVVNEALMAGTPAICSTACGAAELIRQPWLGTVFSSGNVEELAEALKKWSASGQRILEERQRIREWSRCIEGESLAGYFGAIMAHIYEGGPRPAAPWRGEWDGVSVFR